jgi:hypothetical protein
MNAQDGRLVIKKDRHFFAGIAALVLSAVIMPLSALVVPLLGLSTTQTTTLFVVLACFPDTLFVVAVGLLGTKIFRYFIHKTRSALRAALDRRFRAGGAIYGIFDKCFGIFSVAERHLGRLDRAWTCICRNAVVFAPSPKLSSF